MDLEKQEPGTDPGPRRLAMSEADKKLAEIATARVERRFVEKEVRLVGKVDYDETRIKTISAWIPSGRIVRQFVDYTGVPVQAGEHLVEVYSPELLTAQEELLGAVRAVESGGQQPSVSLRGSDKRRLDSVREKLRLWGLTAAQIEEIEKRGTAEDHVMITSPTSGIVIHKGLNEGDYVKTGTPIYRIADLDHLWVKLDAYESDLPWIHYGQKVVVETEALPGELFEGWVSFRAPFLDERTRTVKVRVNLDNSNRRLMPGMFVRAVVKSRIASGGPVMDSRLRGKWICPMHPEVVEDGPASCRICGMPVVPATELGHVHSGEDEKPLVVPATAVLLTGRRAVVYVEVPGTAKPTCEGREVLLGPRAGDDYIVIDGLAEAERVVVNGNFKIDSALQIVAKRSMMSLGTDPGPFQGKAFAPLRAAATPLFEAYFAAHDALAGGDHDRARVAFERAGPSLAAVARFVTEDASEAWRDMEADFAEATRQGARSESIEADVVAFRTFSRAMLDFERLFGHAGEAVHYETHCPMAFDHTGASWLQLSRPIRNPFEASMRSCGEIVQALPGRGGRTTPVQAVPPRTPAPADPPSTEKTPGKQVGKAAASQPATPPEPAGKGRGETGLARLYSSYFELHDWLAKDAEAGAKAAFGAVEQALSAVGANSVAAAKRARWAELAADLGKAARAGSGAGDIDAARVAFRALSVAMLALEDALGHPGPGDHHEVFCPMAFGDGAAWLQESAAVLNPYYGASMLRCGNVRRTIKPTVREQGR